MPGSARGWLGAVGFGPAAFCLELRAHWFGWFIAARTTQLRHVRGLARLLLGPEVKCQNLATKVLHRALARVAQDGQDRYHCRSLLVETFVNRTAATDRTFAAGNWQRLGTSSGRGRLGAKIPGTSRKDRWGYPLGPTARAVGGGTPPPPVTPHPLGISLAQSEWCAHELAVRPLGDDRPHRHRGTVFHPDW